MNNECGAQTVKEHTDRSRTYVCNRTRGHAGSHEGWDNHHGTTFHAWQQAPAFYAYAAHPAGRGSEEPKESLSAKFKIPFTPQPTPVPLDVDELKILAYYLAGVEKDEDDLALKEKIDAALKAAL